MSKFEELKKAKITAREKLNSLPPQEAQEIVNEVIFADMWEPKIPDSADYDNRIPVPKFLMPDEENS